MNSDLFTINYQPVHLFQGWPKRSNIPILQFAQRSWTQTDYGTILLQEISTKNFMFRYFIFQMIRDMIFYVKEKGEGPQSLIALKGSFTIGPVNRNWEHIEEGQFTLLNEGAYEYEAHITGGKECQIFNTYYLPQAYHDLISIFPSIKKDLLSKRNRIWKLPGLPKYAGYSLLDSVHQILLENYQPELQQYFWELKLKQCLFMKLAQVYKEESRESLNSFENEMVEKAREIIETAIAVHYSNEELAKMIGWNETSLKTAFRKKYGMGLYEYLRRLRMLKARELLLQGEQVKTVAPAIGMRPSSFTMEFQKYFGYKATSLKKGG